MISNEEGRERPITTITTAATRCSRLIETTVVRRGGGVPDVNEFLCSSHHRQLFCDDVFGLLKGEFFLSNENFWLCASHVYSENTRSSFL